MIMNNEKPNYWQYAVGFFALLMLGGIIGATAFILSERSNQPVALTSTQTVQSTASVDLKIKGNRNSKIYHLRGCPNYDDIADRNIVWFKTNEEAEENGYRMARNC